MTQYGPGNEPGGQQGWGRQPGQQPGGYPQQPGQYPGQQGGPPPGWGQQPQPGGYPPPQGGYPTPGGPPPGGPPPGGPQQPPPGGPPPGWGQQPPGQFGGYPGGPGEPPKSKTGLIVGIVVAVVVLVGAGIGAYFLWIKEPATTTGTSPSISISTPADGPTKVPTGTARPTTTRPAPTTAGGGGGGSADDLAAAKKVAEGYTAVWLKDLRGGYKGSDIAEYQPYSCAQLINDLQQKKANPPSGMGPTIQVTLGPVTPTGDKYTAVLELSAAGETPTKINHPVIKEGGSWKMCRPSI